MYTLKHKEVKDAKLENTANKMIDSADRSDLLLFHVTSGQPLIVCPGSELGYHRCMVLSTIDGDTDSLFFIGMRQCR